jgi:hypothetical protein
VETRSTKHGDETMTTKAYDIYEIAKEFDRLFAADESLVDLTRISWGDGQLAGHSGHEYEGEDSSTVGWYCDGGNVGHPLLDIANDDLQRAGEALAGMESAKSLSEVEAAFEAAGVHFERRV